MNAVECDMRTISAFEFDQTAATSGASVVTDRRQPNGERRDGEDNGKRRDDEEELLKCGEDRNGEISWCSGSESAARSSGVNMALPSPRSIFWNGSN